MQRGHEMGKSVSSNVRYRRTDWSLRNSKARIRTWLQESGFPLFGAENTRDSEESWIHGAQGSADVDQEVQELTEARMTPQFDGIFCAMQFWQQVMSKSG